MKMQCSEVACDACLESDRQGRGHLRMRVGANAAL